ncbi:MAG: Cj0069 family protein, partial [Isosphaeraceae bacterium]
RPTTPGIALPGDTKIKCTEAVDNHVEYHTLFDFMTFCERYIVGENGMIVDMRFLPRIKEGEIRILLVGPLPIFVVHKKPADAADAFSATLFSGAKYTYDEPGKWQDLVDSFLGSLPEIMKKLGDYEIPLIWTADFILDTNIDGTDKYVLGEINCSCVGFTTHLDHGIQETIADEIIRTVEKFKA